MTQHEEEEEHPWDGLEITGSVRNLSPSIWNLTHLTSLYLNKNCLTRLPPDIGRLTNLRHLDLSSNKLRGLPREIGELILLEVLLVKDNQIRALPLEMGKLFNLKKLELLGNPPLSQEIVQIYQEPKGTQKLISYLLDHLSAQFPAPRPPQRPWILMDQPVDRTKPSCMFTTMCYNVLCDKYATRQLYGYCPPWALSWDYRKQSILEELRAYNADIIALQEVETEQYHDYFLRELQQDGYEGIFSPKSRAKTMLEGERKHVDGCAIFYKTNKFSLIQEHLVEFNQLAMANAEGSDDMLNRVMTKDNIALVALLQIKEGAFDLFQASGGGNDVSSQSVGIGNSGNGGVSNNVGGNGTISGNNSNNVVQSLANLSIGSASTRPGSLGGNQGDNIGALGDHLDSGGGSTILGGINRPGDDSVNSASFNNTLPTNLTSRPLHQQRLLVCTAHIHWDPEFCDVKIIQTIMLMHELQTIANQAAKDLLAAHAGNGDINSTIKQYYLNNKSLHKPDSNGQNHIGLGRPSSLISNTTTHHANNTLSPINNFFNNDQDELNQGGDINGRIDNIGVDIIPMILCVDSNSLPESSVVEFLTNGCISADHPDFKELAYKDCLRKICNSRSSALVNNSQHSNNNNQCNQYSSRLSSISTTLSSSSTSSTEDQQQNKIAVGSTATADDSATNTSSGNGDQRSIGNGIKSHGNAKSTTMNSESNYYTHPFAFATAYTGEGSMPFTNYT